MATTVIESFLTGDDDAGQAAFVLTAPAQPDDLVFALLSVAAVADVGTLSGVDLADRVETATTFHEIVLLWGYAQGGETAVGIDVLSAGWCAAFWLLRGEALAQPYTPGVAVNDNTGTTPATPSWTPPAAGLVTALMRSDDITNPPAVPAGWTQRDEIFGTIPGYGAVQLDRPSTGALMPSNSFTPYGAAVDWAVVAVEHRDIGTVLRVVTGVAQAQGPQDESPGPAEVLLPPDPPEGTLRPLPPVPEAVETPLPPWIPTTGPYRSPDFPEEAGE